MKVLLLEWHTKMLTSYYIFGIFKYIFMTISFVVFVLNNSFVVKVVVRSLEFLLFHAIIYELYNKSKRWSIIAFDVRGSACFPYADQRFYKTKLRIISSVEELTLWNFCFFAIARCRAKGNQIAYVNLAPTPSCLTFGRSTALQSKHRQCDNDYYAENQNSAHFLTHKIFPLTQIYRSNNKLNALQKKIGSFRDHIKKPRDLGLIVAITNELFHCYNNTPVKRRNKFVLIKAKLFLALSFFIIRVPTHNEIIEFVAFMLQPCCLSPPFIGAYSC